MSIYSLIKEFQNTGTFGASKPTGGGSKVRQPTGGGRTSTPTQAPRPNPIRLPQQPKTPATGMPDLGMAMPWSPPTQTPVNWSMPTPQPTALDPIQSLLGGTRPKLAPMLMSNFDPINLMTSGVERPERAPILTSNFDPINLMTSGVERPKPQGVRDMFGGLQLGNMLETLKQKQAQRDGLRGLMMALGFGR